MFSRRTSSGRGAQARQAELSSPAKASFPKKEPFEATVAGPARPPRSRQAGSGALPHGTRGRFTHSLALAASHTPCVHTPRAMCVPTSAVYTQKSHVPQTSPRLLRPDPATARVTKTVFAWLPISPLLSVSCVCPGPLGAGTAPSPAPRLSRTPWQVERPRRPVLGVCEMTQSQRPAFSRAGFSKVGRALACLWALSRCGRREAVGPFSPQPLVSTL